MIAKVAKLVKLRAVQPAAFEPVPEQDRIHLPGEFMDAPDAILLDDFAGRVERQAVEATHGIDLAPVFADIRRLFKSDTKLLNS